MATTPSHFQTLGFSLHLWRPQITITEVAGSINTIDYNAHGSLIGTYQASVQSYSHSIAAMGGFQSAEFSLLLDQDDFEYWYGNGVGLHVEVFGVEGLQIWEGRVNSVSFNIGGLSAVRGPLLNVINTAYITYTPRTYIVVEWRETPPRQLGPSEDADSQRRYGLCIARLAGGEMKEASAQYYLDAYLAELKHLGATKQLDLSGGGSEPTATFSCRGYYAWLNYPYSCNDPGGNLNVSDKIGLTLLADPNGFFSTASIEENTLQVETPCSSTDAWTFISDLTALGDVNANRYIFGIYSNQVADYRQIPDSVYYFQHMTDGASGLIGFDQRPIYPWNVRPGFWLRMASFDAGMEPVADVRADPRCMFIENITYTAPYDLKLQGGRSDKLSQFMARFGLAG